MTLQLRVRAKRGVVLTKNEERLDSVDGLYTVVAQLGTRETATGCVELHAGQFLESSGESGWSGWYQLTESGISGTVAVRGLPVCELIATEEFVLPFTGNPTKYGLELRPDGKCVHVPADLRLRLTHQPLIGALLD